MIDKATMIESSITGAEAKLQEIRQAFQELKDELMLVRNDVRAEIIIDQVCAAFGISKELLISPSRTLQLVIARSMCAAMLRNLLPAQPLKSISMMLGRTNHSTTIHMIKTHYNWMDTDPKYRKKFNAILNHIKTTTQHA